MPKDQSFVVANSSEQENQVEEEKIAESSRKSCKLSDEKMINSEEEVKNEISDSSLLISQLGRDLSIYCLLQLSRSDYDSIAALNRSFRSLIKSGELYEMRKKLDIVEHWIYFSCNILEWEVFDPNRGRSMELPKMICKECFLFSDKESLAVGTELLVFGREIESPVVYKYSILTNAWSVGSKMNTPRCLFASASIGGGIGILAGGCDPHGNILSSAELYNSDTGTWETLPDLNTPRKMCSGVFMDGKFYALGGVGVGVGNSKQLLSGEEFDPKTRKWCEIPNMLPAKSEGGSRDYGVAEAPPLVAVVRNVLYLADYEKKEVKRYDKEGNLWVTIGKLPEELVTSMSGWGLAFRGCGDRLIVIGGGYRDGNNGGKAIDVNSWVAVEGGEPQWNRLARRRSGSFVYNCTVMGC